MKSQTVASLKKVTAENLATKYNITRTEIDEYALLSQKRWAAANIPIRSAGRRGFQTMSKTSVSCCHGTIWDWRNRRWQRIAMSSQRY